MSPNELRAIFDDVEKNENLDMDKDMRLTIDGAGMDTFCECEMELDSNDNKLEMCFLIPEDYEVHNWGKEEEQKDSLSIVNIYDNESHIASFLVDGEVSKAEITKAVKKEHDEFYRVKLLAEENPVDTDRFGSPNREDVVKHLSYRLEEDLGKLGGKFKGKNVHTFHWDFDEYKHSRIKQKGIKKDEDTNPK